MGPTVECGRAGKIRKVKLVGLGKWERSILNMMASDKCERKGRGGRGPERASFIASFIFDRLSRSLFFLSFSRFSSP